MKKIFKFVPILFLLLLIGCSTGEGKMFDKALELQHNKKYEEAIKVYKEIIDKYPKSKFVSNSNVKLNQCINLIVKQGDEMVLKKDYFKAVAYYEDALKFKTNNVDLENKISKTKKMAAENINNSEIKSKIKEKTKEKIQNKSENVEYKNALNVLNKYKGKKINDFSNDSKIMQMIISWQSAWESQDINVYKSYYDTDFIGITGGTTMNYNQWMQYKNELFKKYTNITIASRMVDATLYGNIICARFEQWFNGYGQNRYSDHTFKELTFKYSDNKGWLIVGEKPY